MDLINDINFHDLLEYPWKKTFIILRAKNLAVTTKILKETTSESGQFVYKNFGLVDGLTFVDPFRMALLIDVIKKVKDVPGDIVECGSFKGGSGIMMATALKQLGIKKHIHLFDSFQGLPEPDSGKDKGYSKGMFRSDYEALLKKIELMGLNRDISLHRGWFNKTVPDFLAQFKGHISLVHIDCDLYSSTNDCFPFLYPLVSQGGGIVLDDFNEGGRGEKRAVLEFLRDSREIINVGAAPQAFLFKNKVTTDSGFIYTDAGFTYDFGYLFGNKDYLDWLQNKMGESYKEMVIKFLANHQ